MLCGGRLYPGLAGHRAFVLVIGHLYGMVCFDTAGMPEQVCLHLDVVLWPIGMIRAGQSSRIRESLMRTLSWLLLLITSSPASVFVLTESWFASQRTTGGPYG